MMLLTADCIPVAIARADGGRLAVLHAGLARPGGRRSCEAGRRGGRRRGRRRRSGRAPGRAATRWATTSPRGCRPASAPTSCATAAPTCGCARGARSRRPARGRGGGRGRVQHLQPGPVLLAPARPRRHRPPGRRGGAACLTPAVVAANLARIRELVGPQRRDPGRDQVRGGRRPAGAARGRRHAGRREPHRRPDPPSRSEFGDLFTWDFIGHVQSRKVRDLVGRVRLIHAVDSLSACEQLERRREPGDDRRLPAAGERRRRGHEVRRRAGRAWTRSWRRSQPLAGVRFRGLMTMPPAVADPELARPWFAALRELRDRLAPAVGRAARVHPPQHGHEPGLRRRRAGGSDDRAGGWRPLRAVEFSVTWP